MVSCPVPRILHEGGLACCWAKGFTFSSTCCFSVQAMTTTDDDATITQLATAWLGLALVRGCCSCKCACDCHSLCTV